MSWRYVTLRNTRVLARCNARGELMVEDGRVEIRYRRDDGRVYRASPRNLTLQNNGAILPDDACVAADGTASSGRTRAEDRQRQLQFSEQTGTPIDIYTDGACTGNPGPAGMGAVLIDGSERRELSVYLGVATNNVAELSAIKSAAEAVSDPSRPVLIHTDSKYCIGVLTKGWKIRANTELVAEVREALDRLPYVRLVYVPGHAGHEPNERADQLAREAIRDRASRGWARTG